MYLLCIFQESQRHVTEVSELISILEGNDIALVNIDDERRAKAKVSRGVLSGYHTMIACTCSSIYKATNSTKINPCLYSFNTYHFCNVQYCKI